MSSTPKNQLEKGYANSVFTYVDGKLKWNDTKGKRYEFAKSRDKDGYVVVHHGKFSYKVHNVVWNMHNGRIPHGYNVDHINRVKDDNRIENLRLVTHKQNMNNLGVMSTNKSGVKGVHFSKRRNKYVSQIMLNGKKMWLGAYQNLDDAVRARHEAEIIKSLMLDMINKREKEDN